MPCLGLVHPCKLYNIFAVGAPVVYIGPDPSHVTEAVKAVGGASVCGRMRYGEGDQLAEGMWRLKQLLRERREAPGGGRTFWSQTAGATDRGCFGERSR